MNDDYKRLLHDVVRKRLTELYFEVCELSDRVIKAEKRRHEFGTEFYDIFRSYKEELLSYIWREDC